MRILNFGSCNIDYVYSLDHIVRPGETERTNLMEVFPGGKGLNQSIAAARAGADVCHAGFIGPEGECLRTLLQESGVDVTYMQMTKEKNGHAIIQVSAEGENSIFLYPGSNEVLTESYIDSVLTDFTPKDMVVLQNETNLTDYIVDKAYEKGLLVALNPSPCNVRIKRIDLHKISYLILNEVEAADLTGCQSVEDSLSVFRSKYPHLTVVLTCGKQGSTLQNDTERLHQCAYPVDTVDTTAAGDTFLGYFLSGVAGGSSYSHALRSAAAAAALAVTQKGAAPSIPTADRVEAFLKDRM